MSFSQIQPDLQGFADAQAQSRAKFGRDVRFYAPAQMLYDPAIPASEFDLEGIPLDPLAGSTPVASADVGISNLTIVGSANCLVVFRPLQTSIMRRDETFETQLAIRSAINRDLILDIADRATAEAAEYFEVGTLARDPAGNVIYPEQWTPDDGELWKVVNLKYDTFGWVPRLILYGQGTR